MKKIFLSLGDLHFGRLMAVYEEGNRENARAFYPNLDANAAILEAEQDFYAYLRDVFFTQEGAFYGIWEENGQYISALRMEPYADGFLLTALETRPDCRGRGYAKMLIRSIVEALDVPVYSHVRKDNSASLKVHAACGFQRISHQATYLDGTVNEQAVTLYCKNTCKQRLKVL